MSSHITAPASSIASIHAPNPFSANPPALQDADAAAAYSAVNPMQPMMNRISFTMEGMRDAT